MKTLKTSQVKSDLRGTHTHLRLNHIRMYDNSQNIVEKSESLFILIRLLQDSFIVIF